MKPNLMLGTLAGLLMSAGCADLEQKPLEQATQAVGEKDDAMPQPAKDEVAPPKPSTGPVQLDCDAADEPPKYDEPMKPDLPDHPGDDGCSGRVLDGAGTCLSWDEAKIGLAMQCAADGLELARWDSKDQEGCPQAGRHAWGLCCPLPEPGPSDCLSDYLGDGACYPEAAAKMHAYAACGQLKRELTDLWADPTGCDPGLARVKYNCCVLPPTLMPIPPG